MPDQQNEQVDDSIVEELNFNKPNFEFIPKGSHEYTQRGPYLLCKSCELEHAIFIGMDKIMVGIQEDGQPILQDRSKEGR